MSPDPAHYDFFITGIGHVMERKPNPEWRLDHYSNPHAYVIAYCIDGKATYSFDNKIIHVDKGDLLFIPLGLARSAASDPVNPWTFYSVAFYVQFPGEADKEAFHRLGNFIRSPHHYKLLPLFAEFCQIWSGKRIGYLIRCRSILMDIVYYIVWEQDRSAYGAARYNAIERTVNLILSQYRKHFTIDELSELAGLSTSHFRLLFKKITGMTSIQYQHQVRINKAKDLLLSGECNVTEAALAVGFQDIYYFSRLFKKLTGTSPSDYIV